MIAIKETPLYITREMCFDAGIEHTNEKICYAALDERNICGYCIFTLKDKTAVIEYAKAPTADILDGVVRAAIAGGEEKGAEYYDFDIPADLAEKLILLGFRKAPGTTPHSIAKLFTACTGCQK